MNDLLEIGFCVAVLSGLIYAVMTWGIPADYDDDRDEEEE